MAKILYPSLKNLTTHIAFSVFKRNFIGEPKPKMGPFPPFTDQMCFVTQDMGRNSMNQDVLVNIQIVRCKPGEICEQQRESQYYGMGLG